MPNQQSNDRQRSAPAAKADTAAGFKPLALPALAGCVHTARAVSAKRTPAIRDVPAILRKDAQLG